MLLSEFNQTNANEVNCLLKQCVHIERWANEIEQCRPFKSKNELISYAQQQANTWTWEELLAALNTHPRIGEKKAKAPLSEKEQNFSDREQSALNQNEETLLALYEGNVAYEKKYGYIFLIKASGLTSEDILTALKYRLLNDPEMEKRIVHQQLSEIALLRLSQEVQ